VSPLEAMIEGYYQAVWPEQAGADYPTEWAQFQPGAPLFAIPEARPAPVALPDAGGVRRWPMILP
jgi:hypothetical protein